MAIDKDELKKIKGFIFDVDGVLSLDTTPLDEFGDPMRTANVKDGYAIRNALGKGYKFAIITGGYIERVKLRYKKLGVKNYYEKIRDKVECLKDFMEKEGLKASQILYMGDDLVDFFIMQEVGLPVCPEDAVAEIKTISRYISKKKGGMGCVREVIEMVLKAQDNWLDSESYYWNSF